MEKKELRKLYRKKRNALSPEEVTVLSERICQRIRLLPEYEKADGIFCYMAFRNEVDPASLIRAAWEDGKAVYLPRVEGEEMNFYRYRPSDPLTISEMGIPEPDPSADPVSGAFFLMIMPGLAFDRTGHRLGYGGGFYDRYLSKHWEGIYPVGAAYQFQLSETLLPAEPYDFTARAVVTEQKTVIID